MTIKRTAWYNVGENGLPVRSGEYEVSHTAEGTSQAAPRRSWFDTGQGKWLGIIPDPSYWRGLSRVPLLVDVPEQTELPLRASRVQLKEGL